MIIVKDEQLTESHAAEGAELQEEARPFPPDDAVCEFVEYLMEIGVRL